MYDNGGALKPGGVYVIFGDPKTGLWCPYCALPSRIEVPIRSLSDNGVSGGSSVTRCLETACASGTGA